MSDEGIDDKSVLLLDDGDLKELGFKMGERRLLMKWMMEQQKLDASAEVSPQPSSVNIEPVPELPAFPSSVAFPASSPARLPTVAAHSPVTSTNSSSKLFKV